MRYCFTQLPPEFQRFELAENSIFWRGAVRCGNTLPSEAGREMIKLCNDLLNGDLQMIKDRPKIAAGIGGNFFVKLYKLPGLPAQICRRFRRGRAIHCLFAAEFLQNCGAMTPQVVAALELHRGRHIYDFLITEKLPEDCRTLNYFFSENGYSAKSAWEVLMEKVLPEVARIHDAGIAHGDLNLRNLYLLSGKTGFIDLDSATCNSAPLDIPTREKELARLLSGFLRIPAFKTMDVDESVATTTAAYREYSGVLCSKSNIIQRANYLISR